jgi:hypothetical protein
VAKVKLEAVLKRGRPTVAGRLGQGANRCCCLGFFLATIWRDILVENLTRLVAKWGQWATEWAGQPPYWADLAGASAYRVHMVRG